MRLGLGLIVVGVTTLAGVSAWALCGVPPPQQPCNPSSFSATNPAASGYSMVFGDDFNSVGLSNVDMANTGNAGFHWYLRKPFGYQTTPASEITSDANGLVMTLGSSSDTAQVELSTAYPDSNGTKGWIGTAFGNGGFFEARIAFDGPSVVNQNFNGWPAFWAMDVAHWQNSGGDQWPGQAAGYTHFIEDDWFEYDNTGDSAHKWGSGVVDWSGIFNTTNCPGYDSSANTSGFCRILNDGVADSGLNNIFICVTSACPALVLTNTTFHTIGALWVPGNAANNFHGFRRIYYDGQPAATPGGGPTSTDVGWTDGAMPTNPPGGLLNSPEVFSIYDQNKIVMNIGTGNNLTMHVQFVHAWQIPGCGTVNH